MYWCTLLLRKDLLPILTGAKSPVLLVIQSKKTKQGYDLYSCTSKYVPGGKPKCCPSPISAINHFWVYTTLLNPGKQIHLTSSEFIARLNVHVHNKL